MEDGEIKECLIRIHHNAINVANAAKHEGLTLKKGEPPDWQEILTHYQFLMNNIKAVKKQMMPKPPIDNLGTYSVENLLVSGKIINLLICQGLYTVGQLVLLKEDDLIKVPGLTNIHVVKLKTALKKEGLRFGMRLKRDK